MNVRHHEVPTPRPFLVTCLRPEACVGSADFIRQLHLIVIPQSWLFVQPPPLSFVLPKTSSPPSWSVIDDGEIGELFAAIVESTAGTRGQGCAGGAIAAAAALLCPPATEKRCQGGKAGAHDTDVGLAAGPDEDGRHGPCEVGRFHQRVDRYDANDTRNADTKHGDD